MKRSRFPLIVTLFILLIFYAPLLILAINSFNASRFGTVWTGFSLQWYYELFSSDDVWSAFTNSMIVAVISTAIATFFGTVSAYALYRYPSWLQKIHYSLIYFPLVMPDILMGISLLVFLGWLFVPLGLTTIIIAHATFSISYITMIVLAKLRQLDESLLEASYDLGAGLSTTCRRVLIPLLMPSIISGALIAFTLSLDDFIITTFVAGPGSMTLPLYVYSMIKFGSTPVINALSTILIVVTFLIVWGTRKLSKEETL